MAMVSVDTVAS